MTPEEQRFLLVGAGLFVLGAIGFITRRNLILMVLSAELMLHGVSLTLVTFGRIHQTNEGQAFTIFTLTVAACEAGLALALVLSLYRKSHSLDIQLWSELRESDMPGPKLDALTAGEEPVSSYEDIPKLTPAGIAPKDPPRTTASTGTTTSART
jgi:NADH-quinone oxidoreductase subunit K